jgi:hypothetical protein
MRRIQRESGRGSCRFAEVRTLDSREAEPGPAKAGSDVSAFPVMVPEWIRVDGPLNSTRVN